MYDEQMNQLEQVREKFRKTLIEMYVKCDFDERDYALTRYEKIKIAFPALSDVEAFIYLELFGDIERFTHVDSMCDFNDVCDKLDSQYRDVCEETGITGCEDFCDLKEMTRRAGYDLSDADLILMSISSLGIFPLSRRDDFLY